MNPKQINQFQKVVGVILAGGRAARMAHRDKGLVSYNGFPLVHYAITALSPVVDHVVINANRNIEHYQQFGLPVIIDQTDSFDGPLAGVLAAMAHTHAETLLVIPCDCPLIKAEHIQKLLFTHIETRADIAVAFDGKRLNGVFFAANTTLRASLRDYLASGQRKVSTWMMQQNLVQVDFSHQPEIFTNINTMSELSILETQYQANTH